MSSRLQRGSLCSIVPKFLYDAVASVPGGRRLTVVAAAATVFPNFLLRYWSPFLPKLLDTSSQRPCFHIDSIACCTFSIYHINTTRSCISTTPLVSVHTKRTTHRHRLFLPPTWHHRLSAQRFLIDPRALRERERERERERDLCRGNAHLGLLPT